MSRFKKGDKVMVRKPCGDDPEWTEVRDKFVGREFEILDAVGSDLYRFVEVRSWLFREHWLTAVEENNIKQDEGIKVGDYVGVREPTDKNEDPGWVEEMDWFVGKVCKVDWICPDTGHVTVDGHIWSFSRKWLKLVTDGHNMPMSEQKTQDLIEESVSLAKQMRNIRKRLVRKQKYLKENIQEINKRTGINITKNVPGLEDSFKLISEVSE